MVKTFSAQIDDFVSKVEKRMIAVAREATQRTINAAQTPASKGGRMRVDTGFLRASGQMSFNGLPTGPRRPDKSGSYDYDSGTMVSTLANLRLGTSVFFGWTAGYAQIRELKDGFLVSELDNWQSTVDDVVREVKRRI